MSTPQTITDAERLDAMFRNAWRGCTSNGKSRIKGVTGWMESPRAAVDEAIALGAVAPVAKGEEKNPVVTNDAGPTWQRWETRLFRPETTKFEIAAIARTHGWKVSIVRFRKTGEWRAMAMDSI